VRVRGEVEAILSRHTGQDAAKLRTDTDRDRVFTAEEAVAYGLVDRVLSDRG
jgi:ATP-dependent Clp protease protease subunit